MRSFKKFIAVLLSVLMVMAVSPVAFADDTTSEETTAVAEWYTSYGTRIGSGTLAEAVAGVSKGGKIQILADIAISETINFTVNATVYGNGYTITRDSSYTGVMFSITDEASITLDGVAVDGTYEGASSTDTIFAITNGSLTLSNDSALMNNYASTTTGGAVQVGTESGTDYTAAFIMESGTEISGCTGSVGGAVAVNENGTFTMDGGSINNCIARTSGGAVAVLANTAVFTMGDAEITSCEAGAQSSGMGSAVYAESGTVTIEGATISGNTNSYDLGALAVAADADVTVGGYVVIYDNYGSSTATQSNVYLASGATITVSPDFETGAKIGVTTEEGYEGGEEPDFISSKCDITGYVYDDASECTYYVSNGVVTFLETITVTFDPGNGTCDVASKVYAVDVEFGYLPTPDDRDGFEFLGWYTESGVQVTESSNVTYYSDMTLYAEWENLNALDSSPLAVIGRFFERIGDLMRLVFDFLINLFYGGGDQDLSEL